MGVIMGFKFQWAAAAACGLCVLAGSGPANSQTVQQPGVFLTPPAKPNATCVDGSKVTVGASTICGVTDDYTSDVYVYKGIRYATAKRWADADAEPLPPSLQAVDFEPECPQLLSPVAKAAGVKISEDCLFLNVWRPAKAAGGNLPVMVFIHGGAFVNGAGSDAFYDGGALAAHGAIVVTLNYRLGALGFLVAHKYGRTAVGNYGLRDQQLAMKWVRDNITQFGGNSSNITLFGESAGAMSVALHLFDIPSSKLLFDNALMESNVGGSVYRTPDQVALAGKSFLKYLCRNYGPRLPGPKKRLSCADGSLWLDKVPADKIAEAQFAYLKKNPVGDVQVLVNLLSGQTLPWAPVVDGKGQFVLDEPYKGYADGMTAKPFAFGVNKDEGAMFAAMLIKGIAGKRDPSTIPGNLTYRAFLNLKYPKIRRRVIEATDPQRYDPAHQKGGPGYSAAGTATANVFTDYVFTCGDVAGADAAIDQGKPIYAYTFTQPVFFNITRMEVGEGGDPVDNGACDPGQDLTCHATELPYVFNTVKLIPSVYPNYKLGPTDQTLADAMNAAWYAFAANPNDPGPTWINYQKAAAAYRWDGTKPGESVDLKAHANCKIWSKQPYPSK